MFFNALSIHFLLKLYLEMLQSVIEISFKYPEQKMPDDSESREQDRVICSANIIHQVKVKQYVKL